MKPIDISWDYTVNYPVTGPESYTGEGKAIAVLHSGGAYFVVQKSDGTFDTCPIDKAKAQC